MNPVRSVSLIFGIAYVAAGILGFVPSLVTGGAPADMPSATGSLFGVFPINPAHNVVHIVLGAILLWGATATGPAVWACRVVGIVYGIVGLLGFVMPDMGGMMPIGGNDIWLHLVTAVVLLVAGFAYTREGELTTTRRDLSRS